MGLYLHSGAIVIFHNIILKNKHGVTTLIINRPNSLNSLNQETLLEISQAFQELQKDTEVKAVVITGSGKKAFSVGADLKDSMFSDQTTEDEALRVSELGQKTLKDIEEFQKPVIAAVDGYALGGGLELALACDIIVASEHSSFGQVEINLGLIPGWGGTQRLTKTIGRNRAKSMILTGESISTKEAERIGIVNKIFPDSEFERSVDEFARGLASKSPTALAHAKLAVNRSLETNLIGLQYETRAFAKCFETTYYKERLKAFLKKHDSQHPSR